MQMLQLYIWIKLRRDEVVHDKAFPRRWAWQPPPQEQSHAVQGGALYVSSKNKDQRWCKRPHLEQETHHNATNIAVGWTWACTTAHRCSWRQYRNNKFEHDDTVQHRLSTPILWDRWARRPMSMLELGFLPLEAMDNSIMSRTSSCVSGNEPCNDGTWARVGRCSSISTSQRWLLILWWYRWVWLTHIRSIWRDMGNSIYSGRRVEFDPLYFCWATISWLTVNMSFLTSFWWCHDVPTFNT